MAQEKSPAELYADKTQEIAEMSEQKKAEIEEKYSAKIQQIESLIADISAIPTELAGQSEDFIRRKTKGLQKKIDDKKKAAEDWLKEKSEEVKNWVDEQKQKIQDEIADEIESKKSIIEWNIKMKVAAMLATNTGSSMPDIPDAEIPKETPQSLPVPPTPLTDDEYMYSYKNIKGQFVADLGSNVAKRKHYNPLTIYTDGSDKLEKSKIKREKYKWSFSWSRTDFEQLFIDGGYKYVPKAQMHAISGDKLNSLEEVFQSVNSFFMKYLPAAKKRFSRDIGQTFSRSEKGPLVGKPSRDAWDSYSVWEITIVRSV